MKKTLLFLSGLLCFCLNARAQFVPPGYPETIYPAAATSLVLRPQHASCYAMDNIPGYTMPNNLSIYSWNAGASNVNGIAWCWRSSAGTVLNNFVVNGLIFDLEVGFVQQGGNTFIVAAYYESGVGHQYRIYQWSSGGLTPYGGGSLSTSATYGRISLDAHRLYGIAITWEVGGRIYVKAMNTASGTWVIGNNIEVGGVSTGAIPDVAFAHVTDLDIRIAYVNTATGAVHVVHRDFPTILVASAGPLGFAVDDVNPAGFSSVSGFSQSDNLQLDCPDHYTQDNWSYIYTSDGMNVNTRIQNWSLSSSAITYSLTGWLGSSGNEHLTLAYSPAGNSIYYGWYTAYTGASPVPGYVAVHRGDNGSFIAPTTSYFFNRVANTTWYSVNPVISFSKQNDIANELFAVYAMHGTGGFSYEMRFKHVPWTATSFRPGAPEALGEVTREANNVFVYPNPFREHLSLAVQPDAAMDIYEVSITDLVGRSLGYFKGNIDLVNRQLQEVTKKMMAGVYLLNIYSTNIQEQVRVVKIE